MLIKRTRIKKNKSYRTLRKKINFAKKLVGDEKNAGWQDDAVQKNVSLLTRTNLFSSLVLKEKGLAEANPDNSTQPFI